MIRRIAFAAGLLSLLLAATLAGLYLTNATPIVPAIAESDLDGRPYVVKMHAQWCPVCRVTKDVWSDIQTAYTGKVNLIVLDFTNDDTTRASRAEAARLGLAPLFDEYEGATGYVVILDGRTKEVRNEIKGRRDFAEYQAAIDAAMAGAVALTP